MSDFDMGDDIGMTRKSDKRHDIGLAIGIGLGACFVLGTILCLGLLVRTVVEQASVANDSLSNGIKSLQAMEKQINQMAKDLNSIAQKVNGGSGVVASIAQGTADSSGIERRNSQCVCGLSTRQRDLKMSAKSLKT
jgi:hypothetical protein